VRTPAFWLLGAVTGLSLLGTAAVTAWMMITSPLAGLVTLLLVLGIGAVWLTALLLAADPVERRPGWLVAAAVSWGGSVAVAVGAAGGIFLDEVVAKGVSATFAAQWGAAIAAPYAEEIGKGAGVVMVLLVARPYVTTVWSGALYGALVGLGFALAEDAGYALGAADEVLPDDAAAAAQVLLFRLLVPGLVGHPLFTAAAGAGIAYAWLRRDRSPGRRAGALIGGLSGAALMHAVVNSPAAFAATEKLAALPHSSYWAGYLLAVGAATLPSVWWLGRIRRADARMLLSRAAALAPAAVPPQEVPMLAGVRSRRAAVRAVRRAHGTDAARHARRHHRAQVRLAAALARPYRGHPAVGPYGLTPPVRQWWQEALDTRTHRQPPPADAPAPGPGSTVVAPGPDRRTIVAAGAVLLSASAGLLLWPAAVPAVAGAV
jgi:RsiW-degrading membrane proteinase PrsW (M82 family)